jgi:hypothetical protein
MPREDLMLIMASLNTVREMLTIERDTLTLVMEGAMRNNVTVSTHSESERGRVRGHPVDLSRSTRTVNSQHICLPSLSPLLAVYLAFEKCVDMREDLNKADKKALKEEGKKILREVGEPPAEDDDLLATMAGGVMQGSAMSQGIAGKPGNVTPAIYKSLFPAATKEANVLFAGWIPPVRSPIPSSSGAAAETSMSAFLGGGAGAGAAASGPASPPALDMSSFLDGKPSAAKKLDISGAGDSDEDAPPPPSKSSNAFGSKSFSRGRGGDDDEDEGADSSAARRKGAGAGGSGAGSSSRRRGGGDDDEDDDGGRRRGAGKSSVDVDAAPAVPSFTAAPARDKGADRRRRGRRGGDDDDGDDDLGGRGARRR